MPSQRYYREEQAQQAREAVADLSSLPSEFHARHMQKED